MLVLHRRLDQDIVIDGNIVVRVIEIRTDTVRLGIIAPREVRVDRMEVHEARQAEHFPGERPGGCGQLT